LNLCPHCHTENVPAAERCGKCNAPLRSGDVVVGTLTPPGTTPPGEATIAAPPARAALDATLPADTPLSVAAGWAGPLTPQSGTPSSWTSGVQPGAVLGGRYEILSMLGEGGMGTVYKARDRELDRVVALKVIRPEVASRPEILQRFKQELILARQVTHRNVIRIYDLGSAEGMRFITMELVEGQDLKSLLEQKGKLGTGEAAGIAQQVCLALEAAHSEGVVHRDLKPQNVMIDKQSKARVMDFGVARSLEAGGMTQTGALMGTPEYMSPEQVRGEKADGRSDLFALGIILYEMLSGKTPFAAETAMGTMFKRTQERAAPLAELDRGAPRGLSDIVSRCLETDPQKRYQSAREVYDALEEWKRNPARAEAQAVKPVASRPARRSVAMVGSALAVVLVAGAALGYMFRDQLFGGGNPGNEARKPAPPQPPPSQPETPRPEAPAASAPKPASPVVDAAARLYDEGIQLTKKGNYAEAAKKLTQALEMRRKSGDKRGAAAVLEELGRVDQRQGKRDTALAELNEALKIWRETGDKAGVGNALVDLGEVREAMGQAEEALKLYNEALPIKRGLREEAGQAEVLQRLGGILLAKGQLEEAQASLQSALQVREKLKSPGTTGGTLYLLGEASRRMGEYDLALDEYRRAQGMFRDAGDKVHEAAAIGAAGAVSAERGRFGAALSLRRDALKMIREAGDKGPWLAGITGDYGNALSETGQFEEADKSLADALQRARQLQDKTLIARVLVLQGDSREYRGDFKTARPLYQEAVSTAGEDGEKEFVLKAKLGLARAALEAERAGQAMGTLRGLKEDAESRGLKFLAALCTLDWAEALAATNHNAAAHAQIETLLHSSEKLDRQFIAARSHHLMARVLQSNKKPMMAKREQADAQRILDGIYQEAGSDSIRKRKDLQGIGLPVQ